MLYISEFVRILDEYDTTGMFIIGISYVCVWLG